VPNFAFFDPKIRGGRDRTAEASDAGTDTTPISSFPSLSLDSLHNNDDDDGDDDMFYYMTILLVFNCLD